MLSQYSVSIIVSIPLYSSMLYDGGNGDRSLFRRSIVPKVRCSEGPMFRRAVVPKVRCSEGSLLRRFVTPKLRFRKQGSIFRKRINLKGKYFFFVVFNLQNSLLFLVLHKGRGRVQIQFYRGSSGLGPGGTTPVQID